MPLINSAIFAFSSGVAFGSCFSMTLGTIVLTCCFTTSNKAGTCCRECIRSKSCLTSSRLAVVRLLGK